MSMYIIPAALALIAKFTVLGYAQRTSGASLIFKCMVSVFAVHNTCEVLMLLNFFSVESIGYMLKFYYVVSIAALLSISYYVTSLSNVRKFWQINLGVLIAFGFCTIIVFTDLIIAGTARLSYTDTALRGEFYWMFQALALVLLLVIGAQLYRGYIKAASRLEKMCNLYTAIALLPVLFGAILVIVLMNAGVPINGTVILPIATTLFLVITLASEYQHQSTDIRRYMPFSEERRTTNKIMEIFSSYARDDAGYRDSVTEIERLLVLYKLDRAGGNASTTAENMGMPRSSLYSIFNRLNIKTKD